MESVNWRVLSIQSHVVFGYVGNKSATFPLQLLGFEVDAINSVQLSNHTAYEVFKGQILNEKDLETLMNGLIENGLDNAYTHLLTGYVGNDTFLLEVIKTVKKLKEKNPKLLYGCDPVLGDGGETYVPKELIPIYRDSLIRLADILTPNQTELQFLTGEPGDSLESVLKGIQILHDKGCKVVVITSAEFKDRENQLSIFVSDGINGKRGVIEIPKLDVHFTGTGDLFSALFLAWYTKLNHDVCNALERTVSTVHKILQRTIAESRGSGDTHSARSLELKLIQSKSDIELAPILFKCRII